MSEQSDREPSAAYRAGHAIGALTRLAVVVFALAIVALSTSSATPEEWQTPVRVGALVLGAISALLLGFAQRNLVWTLMGAYVVLVGVGSVLRGQEPKPTGALIAIAVATVASIVGAMIVAIRSGRRSRELERLLFSESTSIAFFVTMLGVVTYGLLEAWLDAPELSMWFVWSFGMIAWIIASAIFKRRYS